jgi:hypothetical protein
LSESQYRSDDAQNAHCSTPVWTRANTYQQAEKNSDGGRPLCKQGRCFFIPDVLNAAGAVRDIP